MQTNLHIAAYAKAAKKGHRRSPPPHKKTRGCNNPVLDRSKNISKPTCRRSFHVYIYINLHDIYEYEILGPKITRYSTHYITKKHIKTPHYILYVLLWLKILVFVILTFSPNMDRIPNIYRIVN